MPSLEFVVISPSYFIQEYSARPVTSQESHRHCSWIRFTSMRFVSRWRHADIDGEKMKISLGLHNKTANNRRPWSSAKKTWHWSLKFVIEERPPGEESKYQKYYFCFLLKRCGGKIHKSEHHCIKKSNSSDYDSSSRMMLHLNEWINRDDVASSFLTSNSMKSSSTNRWRKKNDK